MRRRGHVKRHASIIKTFSKSGGGAAEPQGFRSFERPISDQPGYGYQLVEYLELIGRNTYAYFFKNDEILGKGMIKIHPTHNDEELITIDRQSLLSKNGTYSHLLLPTN
jgi:hypothetical protein